MNKIRLGIYPYSVEFEPVLRHISLLDPEIEIQALISPKGWGLTGKTISAINKEKSWTVVSGLDSVLNEINTIFIPDFQTNERTEILIVKEILKIIPNIDKVILAAKLTNNNVELLQGACAESGCIFENLNNKAESFDFKPDIITALDIPLEQINVPIVAIAGLWEETDKFEVSLALREKFIQNGYHITQIGSRNYCEMLGFHSFPNFMYDINMDAVGKIMNFNRWVKQLTKSEDPDLIIITVPGAIKNLNDKFPKGFGVLPHILFQAMAVDVLLFCTTFEWGAIELLDELSTICKYSFGCEVDCFHMSNMFFDINTSLERESVTLNHVSREKVADALEHGYKDSPIPVFNMLDNDACDKVFNLIEGKLSGDDFMLVT